MKPKKTNNLKKTLNQLQPSWLLFNVCSGLAYYPSLKNLKTKKAFIRCSSSRSHHKETYLHPKLFPINILLSLMQGEKIIILDQGKKKPFSDAFLKGIPLYVALINLAVSGETKTKLKEKALPFITPAIKEVIMTKEARKEVAYLRYLIRYLVKRPKQITLSYYSPNLKKFPHANQKIKTSLKGNLILWGEKAK